VSDSTRPRPRPVLDPAIPDPDRALLGASAAPLVAAHLPAPAKPRLGPARLVGRAVWIPLFAFCYGVLPGGWITLFCFASLDEDDLMSSVFRWGRRAVLAMMITPAVLITLLILGWEGAAAALAAVSFGGWMHGTLRYVGERPEARAARLHHGRYLLFGDFDKPAARLLCRAQHAVDRVLASAAHQAGLLDDIANTVTLRHHEWEIADALAEHTRLRREREAQQPHRLSAPVRELLEPQERALRLSIRSITERIEALETYAARAADTDDALHDWRVLQDLPEQNARYRDLLVRTVRDDLARTEIARLTADAQQAEAALRATLAEAHSAARSLRMH
jgi:hypothetical protein